MAKQTPQISSIQCHVFEPDQGVTSLKTREQFWGIGGEFNYLVCPHCGSWTIHPKPSDDTLSEHYEGYYPPEEFEQRKETPITSIERARARQVWAMLGELNKAESVSSMLDVGTGCAGFLEAFRQNSTVEVRGCDQNPASAALAKTLFGIQVDIGEFSDVNYPAHHFELITLWHCFEHVRQPQDTLAALREYLSTDGTLMIEVPTPGFFGRLFGGRWLFLQAPTHLNLFTTSGLCQQLDVAGFDVVRIQRPWSPSEWAGSFLFSLGFSGFMPRLYFRPTRFTDHLWRVLFLILMPLDLLLTGVSTLLGSSGLLRVYAQIKNENK